MACLALMLYLSWIVVRPFLSVLAWALVMVILFQPVHRRVERYVGPGGVAALLSTVLVIITILAPAAMVTAAALNELRTMAEGTTLSLATWLDPNNPTTGPAVRVVERYASLDRLRDPGFIRDSLQGGAGNLASGSMRLVGGAIGVLVQIALIVFTMFFLFKDGRLVSGSLYDLVPIENRRLQALFRRTRDVIEASVYGTLLLSVIQGAMGGLAFMVLGLPSPILWGVVMTLASIIPMLGAFVVWVPAAIYLAATGQIWQAGALALWGTVAIGMADNVLRPALVGNRTRMHELLVFFGVLGGIQVFGLLGVVLGPVIFAITLALIQALREIGLPPARAQPVVVESLPPLSPVNQVAPGAGTTEPR
jgi:predicted PurR-regulated permease PerM